MPDDLPQDLDDAALDLRPGGDRRRDPRSIGHRPAPSRPGSSAGPPLRGDRTGLLSADAGQTRADDEEEEEWDKDDLLPQPDDEEEEEWDKDDLLPQPDDEEDEETITTGDETVFTPPTAAEVARIIAAKIGGNRTPDSSGVAVHRRQDGTTPIQQNRLPHVADPSPLDDGVEPHELGPTPREKLGQPPKPPVD